MFRFNTSLLCLVAARIRGLAPCAVRHCGHRRPRLGRRRARRGYDSPAEERPALDGKVAEDVWQTAQPYTAFTQQDPDEGEPASEKTEVRLLIERPTSTSASSASTPTRQDHRVAGAARRRR